MSTLLVKHADLLVTMDDHRREILDGGLFVKDGFIEQVGPTKELPQHADEIIDAYRAHCAAGSGQYPPPFLPDVTRAVPAAQNANLFNWLKTLYPDMGSNEARRHPYFHANCPG